jgi:ATP-binding cassette subfamily B protein/subfamily B ATP-binding cassette protein MsbA
MSVMIRNLSFAYASKSILTDMNLSVQTGENIGIVGESGCGKSTLLKLISGLYDAQQGEISVGNAKTSAARRKNVSMVMQNAALFPASIRDNITCGHEMHEDVIRKACVAAQIMEWIKILPEGLDTFVGERGGKVSGGQVQRIAIARAIAKNAPVILLDEPTSALDRDTGSQLMTALQKLTEGKTVIHVSHNIETLCGCNRILRVAGGRLCGWNEEYDI